MPDACPFPGPKSWLCPNDPSRCEHCQARGGHATGDFTSCGYIAFGRESAFAAFDAPVKYVPVIPTGHGICEACGGIYAYDNLEGIDATEDGEPLYYCGEHRQVARDRIKTETPKTDP